MKVNEVLGQWRMKKVLSFDEEELQMKYVAIEKMLEKDDDKDAKIIAISVWDFTPDGNIMMKIPIDKTEYTVEQLEAEGMKVIDGYIISDDGKHWKEKDGEVYADTGMKGEVLGEKVDGWEKLELDEEGLLPMMGGMYLCEKI